MKTKHVLGTLIAAFLVFSTGPTPLTMAQTPSGNQLILLSTTGHGAVLELVVNDFQIETIDHEGQTYHRLIIPGLAQTDIPGQPQVPTRGTLLGITSPERVSVQVLDADVESLNGYRLYPAPDLQVIADELDDPLAGKIQQQFTLDQDLYNADAFYPGQIAELGPTGYLRDQAVAQVQFYPVQYNPVTGEVRLYRRIRVQVTWDAPLSLSSAAPESRGASPAYEHVLQGTLLNYDALERPQVADPAPSSDPFQTTPYSLLPTPYSPLSTPLLGSTASTTNTIKINVTQDGLVQLTGSDLVDAGFDLSGVDPRTIQISNRGVEIPIHILGESDGTLDPDDVVLFYGTAITDVYTIENVYWLEAGEESGQRMPARDGTPSGGATVPSHFPVTLHAEEDTIYWLMPGGDNQEDHWFWEDRISPATSGLPTARDYSLTLNHVSTGASAATVRVRLKGFTGLGHHTRIYLNGHLVDDQSWSGQAVYDHSVSVSHAYLQNGSNIVRVEAADSGDPLPHQVLVNWIEIDYWDTYVAENDELLFGPPAAGTYQLEVAGFSTDDAQVLDVTDPSNVVIITGTAILADGGSYKVQFEDAAQLETRYLALTPAQRKSPASIALDRPSSWKEPYNAADYIIITHEDFYTSTLPLAAHRSTTSGLRVATVMIEDVYDEFNYGVLNPQAIRDFLSYAYHNWAGPAPSYVLLISGATYDYRDLAHLGRVNYVPTHLTVTPLLGESPSDNWFAAVNGGDVLPDMFIGRLTAQTSAEADDMVTKIIQYEQNPPDSTWNTNVLLVADDDEASFEDISEALAARLPYYYTAHKIYLASYSGDPTAGISANINSGRLLANYAGHGNRERWAQENIFTVDDIPALDNADKLPVVTAADCLNGFFIGSSISMAERFIERQDRGAVAVWADTSLNYPSGHRWLMGSFYDAIFQEDTYALGAATTAAKVATYSHSSSWSELVETFVLFGDPATQLGLPTNYPYVESTTPIHGASDVDLDQEIQIVFSKPMSPTTVLLGGPGTAGVTFTPAWSAGNTVLSYAHSGFDYNQTLTLTISGRDDLGNALGSGPVPSTWSFSTPYAPGDLAIGGPATGIVYTTYAFSAAVSPSLATQPITYIWEANGQSPVTHTGRGLNDSVNFNWSTPGTKTITVTASNVAGTATETHDVTIYIPPASVEVSGPTEGAIHTAYTFSATVGPGTTSQPITYVWQGTDQTPVTHTGGGLNDAVTFDWDTPGTKTVTVSASNGGGTVTDTYLVTIKAPPTGVEISGRTAGVVQVDYTFSAAASPANATPPFTYTWEATEQPAVTHTAGDLSDAINFNWDTPGTKTITVTVSNDVGAASSTAEVTLDYSPPTNVEITGPTKAAVDTAYTFSAAVSPITATRPITYVWRATGQAPVTHTAGGWDDAVTFTWNTTGTKSITVTATNAGGSFTQSHQVTIWSSSVDLAGPRAGVVQSDYAFIATVNPSTAPQPVTYVWEATGQAPVTHAGLGLSDSATFNWATPGTKHIIVTATNASGTISNTYEVDITYAPPTHVQVTGPMTGTIDTTCTFDAAVSPITATQPITYVWEATGQVPVTHTGRGLNDAVTLTWATTGTHTITVTAANLGGTVREHWLVMIDEPSQRTVYLPLVIRND